MNIVLYQPEIPPNTGNIMRLCANAGAQLHLIAPLGFQLDNRQLRRAGLDYREWVDVAVHASFAAYLDCQQPPCVLALSTHHTRCYADHHYELTDALLFGPETRGLPASLLDTIPAAHRLRIPMCPNNRSLNLSNAVAIVLFEAWRQCHFYGSTV